MKVLVIGGAGYIGAHVTRALLDNGDQADVLDNLSSGLKQNLFPESKFYEQDILNYPQLVLALKGYDAVVHLAAFKAVGESMLKPEKYSVNNLIGSLNILNAMCEAGVKNIIFSSSASIFGEPQYMPVDEEHPKQPVSYYGFTKLKVEEFMAWYQQLKGINYAALRYFNACGYDTLGRVTGLEKNPANLIPVIMEVVMGQRQELEIFGNDYSTRDGTCVRDYIHVSDIARAHVLALHYIDKNDKSVQFNLGSEQGLTVKEIYDACCKLVNKTIPMKISGRRWGDPATLIASSQKAKQVLLWQLEQSDLETLIDSTYQVYKLQK